MSSSKSLRPLKRGDPAMRGVRIDVVERQQFVVVRQRLLIVESSADAAEPAGAQRFDQRVAIDDRGVRRH